MLRKIWYFIKKRSENYKNTNLTMKNNNNNNNKAKKNMKALSNIFMMNLPPLTGDVICSKLWRDRENILVSVCQANAAVHNILSYCVVRHFLFSIKKYLDYNSNTNFCPNLNILHMLSCLLVSTNVGQMLLLLSH